MKKQKLFFPLLLSLLFSGLARSQGWIPQGEGVLPENYFTWALSAVDEQTVWAISYSAQITDPKLIGTTDGGETWTVKDLSGFLDAGSPDDPIEIHAISADTIWMVWIGRQTGTKTLRLSVNGGETWEVKYRYESGNVVGPALKFGDRKNGYMIDPFSIRVSRTLDAGTSWSTSGMFSEFESGETWGMANPTNWMDVRGDTIWWGTSKYIHRSTDNGLSWEAFDNGFNGNYETKCVSFSQSGQGLAITNTSRSGVLGETHISRSQDGGATWTKLPTLNFPLEGMTDIPGLDDAFIGVGGIFKLFVPDLTFQYLSAYTLDSGENWTIIDDFPLNAVEFVSPTVGWAGRLSYFDYGGNPALFKWDGVNLGNIVKVNDIVNLSPGITPNPFYDRIRIDLSETRKGIGLLRDVSGRIIRQVSFYDHVFELNGLIHLPPGIYILELKGEDFVATQKVVKR